LSDASDQILENKVQRIAKTNFIIPFASVKTILSGFESKELHDTLVCGNKIDVKCIERKIGTVYRFFCAKKKMRFHAFNVLNDVVVMCIKISDRVATIAWKKLEFNFYEKNLG